MRQGPRTLLSLLSVECIHAAAIIVAVIESRHARARVAHDSASLSDVL